MSHSTSSQRATPDMHKDQTRADAIKSPTLLQLRLPPAAGYSKGCKMIDLGFQCASRGVSSVNGTT